MSENRRRHLDRSSDSTRNCLYRKGYESTSSSDLTNSHASSTTFETT